MTEITTRSSIRVKPPSPDHRDRYPDMAHLPKHGAILGQQRSAHAIPVRTEPVPGPLHQDIDSSTAGIMKTEVVTGDSRPSAGGAADGAVRKRNAAGSALVDSSD